VSVWRARYICSRLLISIHTLCATYGHTHTLTHTHPQTHTTTVSLSHTHTRNAQSHTNALLHTCKVSHMNESCSTCARCCVVVARCNEYTVCCETYKCLLQQIHMSVATHIHVRFDTCTYRHVCNKRVHIRRCLLHRCRHICNAHVQRTCVYKSHRTYDTCTCLLQYTYTCSLQHT